MRFCGRIFVVVDILRRTGNIVTTLTCRTDPLSLLFCLQAPVTYASDHVYPGLGKQAAVPTMVVYAEIWSQEFALAHRQLVQLAESGKVRYHRALLGI
jgi:hypothetical protein